VGEHLGGFARFRYDITSLIEASRSNLVAVRVNNENNGIIPQSADFTFCGGIYRSVNILVVNPTHIALNDYGSSGIFISQKSVSETSAEVEVRTETENQGGRVCHYVLRTRIEDAFGNIVSTADKFCKLDGGQSSSSVQLLKITRPQLWQGRQNPYLYTVVVELGDQKKVIDRVEQTLGLRNFYIDSEKGFFLNGKPYLLHGVNRHQDRQDHGIAITESEQREDMRLIEEVGATAIRLCHYQHDSLVYDLADHDGMVLWTEVPFVNEPLATEKFSSNAVYQLRELIRQNFNHPSVLCWGIGNETKASETNTADMVLKLLNKTAKEEDATRQTTYASHHGDDDPRNFNTDILGFNKYYGWYSKDYEQFGNWLDEFHAKYPNRAVGISEYGAGGSVYQHEQNPPIRVKTQAKGIWHPEEWQNEYHEHAWITIRQHPFIWGTFIWNMFDFAADQRKEGDTSGRNDKGLVTYDRQTRKDSFYWYKANWNSQPMVYITSRRDVLRLETDQVVKVYSNADSVELWLNGVSIGKKLSVDNRFYWFGVMLKPGSNRLYAEGTKSGRVVTDSCAWTYTPGTVYRPPADSVVVK
jgi:beta-galactosidase